MCTLTTTVDRITEATLSRTTKEMKAIINKLLLMPPPGSTLNDLHLLLPLIFLYLSLSYSLLGSRQCAILFLVHHFFFLLRVLWFDGEILSRSSFWISASLDYSYAAHLCLVRIWRYSFWKLNLFFLFFCFFFVRFGFRRF